MTARPIVAAFSAALALLLITLGATPAAAHTALDTSDPADGSTTDGAVTRVVLTFTRPVTPLGDAVEVEGPDGPVTVEVTARQDGAVLVATPSDALTDGEYRLEWTVAAQDGHPLDGTVAFTVAGAPAEPEGGDGGAASEPATPGPTTSDEAPHPEDAGASAADGSASTAAAVGGVLARLGGAAALWGQLVGLGGLLFAALVLRGTDRRDVPDVLRVVRWTGALVLGGLVLRLAARAVVVAGGELGVALSGTGLADALAGSARTVFALQALGALAVLAGARRSLPGSWLAVVGVLLATAGQVLDGHSNTGTPWWLVVGVDVAHLAAAATWIGGVVMIGVVLRARRVQGRFLDAGRLGARFSTVGAVAVVVVGVAGVLLAVEILDRPAQLWETSWGLVLLAKVAVVGIVAAFGAHQHFRVVPTLEAPGHGARRAHAAAGRLQRGARSETTLLVVVVVLTAWLVAASVHV
ncbi:copper transport protein [Isoptericola jiangsuensis]|uniref:Copper transport protein n=1 Tax=Isoptericola jiangsuensis TaxID=548579 RepID=A0A2A9EVW4_9MICO|nr:CopD family protein [Isoptericola jiangsuensis]PFG43164.1 copper transport protein [Isoptericola jiangsuensis]